MVPPASEPVPGRPGAHPAPPAPLSDGWPGGPAPPAAPPAPQVLLLLLLPLLTLLLLHSLLSGLHCTAVLGLAARLPHLYPGAVLLGMVSQTHSLIPHRGSDSLIQSLLGSIEISP